MNDLLQINKQPGTTTKITIEKDSNESKAINVTHINQTDSDNINVMKIKEKSTNHHKRPSITHEISSKRIKGHDTIKATPQLFQQLMTTTGTSLKGRQKLQQATTETPSTSARWTSSVVTQKPQQQQQPASNSVLMNLLVSGCDVSAGYYTCLPRPKVAKA